MGGRPGLGAPSLRLPARWAGETCRSRVPRQTWRGCRLGVEGQIRRQDWKSTFVQMDSVGFQVCGYWGHGFRSPVMSTYLQILLLTGARREELAGLRWSDIDFQWASMTIKDKVEGERTIPLTPYVSTLLSCLPRRNEWVFSSPAAAGGRIVEPRIAHNHALKSANIPNLTLHGLRRSFGTLAEWIECPTGVVAQIMGHKPSAIAEKHYRRRSLDLLRMWHTRIESWILNEAGIYQN